MPDGNADALAAALGSDLDPGESVSVTIDHPGQTHHGHTDSYEVRKDDAGNVSVDKWHHDDSGSWW